MWQDDKSREIFEKYSWHNELSNLENTQTALVDAICEPNCGPSLFVSLSELFQTEGNGDMQNLDNIQLGEFTLCELIGAGYSIDRQHPANSLKNGDEHAFIANGLQMIFELNLTEKETFVQHIKHIVETFNNENAKDVVAAMISLLFPVNKELNRISRDFYMIIRGNQHVTATVRIIQDLIEAQKLYSMPSVVMQRAEADATI